MVNQSLLPYPLTRMIEWRRHFHAYPELSGDEYQTREFVVKQLREMGIHTRTFSSHAGVLGTIEGRSQGGVIALRADMDALPIQEINDVAYKSTKPGVMHACGHDGHMAVLLGTAEALQQGRDKWSGTIKLFFQPAEEAAPHGGAPSMIKDGVLETPAVDAIFGLHMWPELPCGVIGIRRGAIMASSDRFTLRIFGAGAHAASPHEGNDAIAMTADILNALSRIIHRQLDPRETATISVGTVHGGERYNVIAKEVTLEGTVRTLNEEIRRTIPEKMRQMITGVCSGYGGTFQLDYQFGYPCLHNSADEASVVIMTASRLLKSEHILLDIKPNLGAEDFAYYTQQIPGAYFMLGCGIKDSELKYLHNGSFDMDERALLIGAQILEETALSALTMVSRRREENNAK
ncbi:M20 family metallopeptidase [Sporomusa aerivorans]|uniref:M20 metallopeptidase family protein n=1 Tax=Sporomusa aerivorans TaxID=204936 RepID=UPI00352B87D9